MTKLRAAIPLSDRWNVEALYPDTQAWEQDFVQFFPNGSAKWPKISSFQGHLADGPEVLKEALETIFAAEKTLDKLYTYAHLRHDEDIAEDFHKAAFSRISACAHEFNQVTSWFEPELLSLPEETINQYLSSPLLQEYRFHIEKITRLKKHTLPAEQEALIALAGQALDLPYKTFNALSDADFVFGKVTDSEGKHHELTHGSYGAFLRNRDRILRTNAFKTMHGHFLAHENSLAELLGGQAKKTTFLAKARKFPSCLEASLYPKNIDTSVYRALIQAVNEEIGALHRYVNLRKQVLKLDQLHLFDMYVPLTEHLDIKMPYTQAEDLVIESVAPLGSEYQNLLRRGLKEERWTDRYENKNKRSGAYSSGCFDSMPYILMNYKELLRDVFTLAHEAGHSMHSLLTRNGQPYQYSRYPIFLAEVASTFNEELLMQLLLRQAKSKEERIYLLNQKIEDIRTTLFRQTMFAEFELMIHEFTEKNVPLTPLLLKEEFRKLNTKYFGPDVFIDIEGEIEWARIPHFYYNFYVYQYATGISAALSLADRVVSGGTTERDAYLSFLRSGCSLHPIQTLQLAGVDMRTAEPVKATIRKFDRLVKELEKETRG